MLANANPAKANYSKEYHCSHVIIIPVSNIY